MAKKTHLGTFVFACLILAFGSERAFGYDPYQYPAPQGRLLYADLVVQGTIQSVTTAVGQQRDFMGYSEAPFPLTVVTITVNRVLKGACDDPSVTFVAPGGYPPGVPALNGYVDDVDMWTYDYQVGQHQILAIDFSKRMRGGEYVAAADDGRFLQRGALWENQATGDMYEEAQILGMVQEAFPTMMAKKADLVVRGIVTDAVVDTLWTSTGAPAGLFMTIEMAVESVLQGSYLEKTITFRMGKSGGRNLSWVVPVPKLYPGDRCVAFLKRDEAGYYPFAGKNGLLKSDGVNLQYGDSQPYCCSAEALVDSLSSKK